MRGIGGTPPPPPGYVPPPLPGVAAGSANIFRGRLVLVFGPAGAVVGIFVYQQGTTPALGNPPIFWATSGTADPFGNPLATSVGVATTLSVSGLIETGTAVPQVQIDGFRNALFVYDGSANLIVSAAATAGVDFFGHNYVAGLQIGAGGQLVAGNTIITTQGELTYSALPPTLGGLLSSRGVVAQFTDSAGNVVLPGDTSYSNAIVNYSLANSLQGGTLFVYQATTFAGPWAQLVQIGGLQNDGDMHFAAQGGAHLVADTILYKLNSSGFGRELWHDMRPLSNSFVGTITNRYPPQYRLAPDGNVEVAGFVQFPAAGGPNFNSVTFFTMPSGYIPLNNTGHKWPIALETNVTPVGTACVQVDTTGAMQFHNVPTAGMASNIASIYGRYPLSSTQLIIS